MLKLSDVKKIKKLDPQNMLASLELLSGQIEETWANFSHVKIPEDYKKCRNIVVMGMGGSGLGAGVFKALYGREISVPLEIINDYHLPGYADEQTLVVACSYSGNTEEILTAIKEARGRKNKLFIITSGGQLARLMTAGKLPGIIFSTENNPSQCPRVGVGYMLTSFAILLNRLGLVNIRVADIKKIMEVVEKYTAKFGVLTVAGNSAKQLSGEIKERSVWFIAAEHLSGSAHIFANQVNESGKRYAGYWLLPEINHHLLEGLFFPKSNKRELVFIFLISANYSTKILQRIEITKNILKKNGIGFLSYKCETPDKLGEIFELLTLGGFFSFYLAMRQGINPSAIPFVNYFKKQLSK